MPIITDPKKIEAASFKIIDKFLSDFNFPKPKNDIIRRVIHTTVDLSYAKELLFHKDAIKNAINAIRNGNNIIVDSNMAEAGVNKNAVKSFKGKVLCFMSDKNIISQSKKLNITRAILSMRKAAKFIDGAIVAIGNAPTALFEVCDLIQRNKIKPALVIGMPVGFVGALESKKRLLTLDIPYITNQSQKGGSAVAAAIVNALLKIAEGGDELKRVNSKV